MVVLCGGFAAGPADFAATELISWLSPAIILHAIATGVLEVSFNDGTPAAILGLGLQGAMSHIITGLYIAVTRRSSVLTRRWVAVGIGYGKYFPILK